MVSSRAAERFDALSTRTGELDDRSNRSLPGRPRPHIRHGLLLEDPHSAISKTNGRGDENHSGITRNWWQYAESARGLRGYGARHLRLRWGVRKRFCSTLRRAPRGRAELYQYSAGRADQRSADGVSLPLGDERGGQLARDRTIVERAGIDTT